MTRDARWRMRAEGDGLFRSARAGLVAVAAMLTSALCVLLLASPAAANVSHAFSGTFGSTTSTTVDEYPIANPTDVEVDDTTNDVYVTDPTNHRIEKFDSAGHFILMFGMEVNKKAVAEHKPEAQQNVCDTGEECQAGASSSSPGGFETPTYLAVDNSGGLSKGDIYVGDTGDNLVQKFNSSGQIISEWGVEGQKNGADAADLPIYGPLFGVAVGGTEGDLYIGGTHYSYNVWKYNQEGVYSGHYRNTSGIPWLKADKEGNLYYAAEAEGFFSPPTVWEETPIAGSVEYQHFQFGTATPMTGMGIDPSTHEVYQDTGTAIAHYAADCDPPITGKCEPADTFGSGHLSGAQGVAVDGTTHTVYVANSSAGDVVTFGDVRPIVTTGAPSSVAETEVTLTGQVDPDSRGEITECYFEYGFNKSYGHTLPCEPNPKVNPYTGKTNVSATLTSLSPGTSDHYRVVAVNAAGATSYGVDETFITTQPPAVDGLTAENLTATGADLVAQVNPNGRPAEYQFEYGTSVEYGQTAPVSPGSHEEENEEDPITTKLNSDHEIEVKLKNLQPRALYHFRLRVTNEDGTTTTVDHTFNFYPPSCPNENVRQQVEANYLPDCRAYELVSPGNAGGTQLYPGGPNTGDAVNPSRFSYTGLWSTIPGSGGKPIDGNGDLYVATRTATAWVTKYVGLPSNEAAVDGGPPQGLYGQGGPKFLGNNTSISNGDSGPDMIQNNVLTNPEMSEFVDFNDGSQEGVGSNPTPIASNGPFVWSSEGNLLARWPTGLSTTPAGEYPAGSNIWPQSEYILAGEHPLQTAPGGIHSLDCPAVGESGQLLANDCPGEVSASSDLSHYVFTTEWNVFAPGGQLSAPGSAYDNSTVSGSTTVVSKTAAGAPIPSEPGDQAGDPLQIPGVSGDGSHILLAAGGIGPCGVATCPTPPCGGTFGGKVHCPSYPSHLYMRVDDTTTYDVSQGHDVSFVGMTSDGSKVFFTSPERLTAEDHDSSVDLYMWSEKGEEEGQPLTLISKGDNAGKPGEPGNSDACNSSFTTGCGVVTYSELSYCQLSGGEGGNCRSDSGLASENGDIYFFSPEQLEGSRGIPDQENLYDYRNGRVQYVTTLTTGPHCFQSPVEGFTDEACSSTPVARMEVSPDDSHMAFATASPITQYNNAGHLEMYTYEPATSQIECASCIPSGEPPTSDIAASQDGLFMTNDGRVFFTTYDALVHGDTNHAIDVYEYVNGRAQLITPGTGETAISSGVVSAIENPPGLLGVSADGRDVYFSTYDTLVPQDHNGLFLKIYDAREDGGFPSPAPLPPCEAADECHGASSSPPPSIQKGTEASLGSGGSVPKVTIRHHKHRPRHHRKHKHKHKRTRRAAGRAESSGR